MDKDFVIYLSKDGSAYIAHTGIDLQCGVVGCGNTPDDALKELLHNLGITSAKEDPDIQGMSNPENHPNQKQYCPVGQCSVVRAMRDKLETLEVLADQFVGDIEDSYGDQGLPTSFMPLVHYIRNLDEPGTTRLK